VNRFRLWRGNLNFYDGSRFPKVFLWRAPQHRAEHSNKGTHAVVAVRLKDDRAVCFPLTSHQ
jgi:hypothetical protein